jgi:NhaA family Na+:H+ antiporter
VIGRPLRAFLSTEAAGGVVLLAAAVIALVWANSPWSGAYESLWETELGVSVGSLDLSMDLHHWVNDGLMTLFFLVVGFEIKRELVVGELNDMRKAALPALAAVGGMVVPATVYLLFNLGGATEGWGIPMATDIAFAVGVLSLLGSRAPAGLKLFVLSLAIVDDIGAILVIAVFYSAGLQTDWLLVAVAGCLIVAGLKRSGVLWVPLYAVIGVGVWFATLESGVHATIAGVVLGLLAPARPSDPDGFDDVAEGASLLSAEPDAQSVHALTLQAKEVVSPADRLIHLLHPWTSFVVIPTFALANAGVRLTGEELRSALASRVTIGIVAGLVIGKILGVVGTSWLSLRMGAGVLPTGMTTRSLVGGGAAAGIGFTVALFIAALAFPGGELLAQAKVGVLLGSLISAVIAVVVLRSRSPAGEADPNAPD